MVKFNQYIATGMFIKRGQLIGTKTFGSASIQKLLPIDDGAGLLISTISKTQQQANMATFLLFQPFMMLSGFSFPIRSMPRIVQWVAEVFPATHYIRVSRAIYIRGEGPITLLPETTSPG